MSKYYLIKYDDNYADEFDVTGHTVLSEKEFNELQSAIDKITYMEFYFGTNEGIEYESPKAIRNAFSFEEISEEDCLTLQRLGLAWSGLADSFIENILEKADEDWED